jgi:hypothetical protein
MSPVVPEPPNSGSWLERTIREAAERGEFDDLEGSGKPLDILDEPYDPNWWVKRWVEREGIGDTMGEVMRQRETRRRLLLRRPADPKS